MLLVQTLYLYAGEKGKSLVSNRRLADVPSVRADKMTEEVKRDDYERNNGPFYISHDFFDNRGPIVTRAFFRKTSSVFQHGDDSSKLSPASYPGAF